MIFATEPPGWAFAAALVLVFVLFLAVGGRR